MPIKSDRWIIEQCETNQMIHPYAPDQIKKVDLPNGELKRVLSFGVSSYGYDMRISKNIRVLRADGKTIIDPKNINADLFEAREIEDSLVLAPHGLVLAQTMEYFKIPRDILTICYGKSTYARCGVFVNVTPFEPEWEGHATIAISNTTANPVRLYAGEGIAQLLFLQSDEACLVSYSDKGGKYQATVEPTAAKT